MIRLATIEAPVIGEPGKVFSTGPEVATSEDGITFYIKGRNSATAFSEVAGCRLAAAVGLLVPFASICMFEDDLYGGVQTVSRAQRNIRPWLRERHRINNVEDLFSVIAVDTWLGNDDRNMGNLVGCALGNGSIAIYMIDFEKSRALATHPFMSAGSLEPRSLWPRDELGFWLRTFKPLRCPPGVLAKIRGMQEAAIRDIILPVAADVRIADWWSASIELLARRAHNIDRLVDDVWKT